MDHNPIAIVPYHDPFDDSSSSVAQISLFDQNPTIFISVNDDVDGGFGVSDYDPFADPILLDIPYECSNYLVGNRTNDDGGVSATNNCQILREITHSDGDCFTQFYLLNFYMGLWNFSNDSTKRVKQFLVQYFEACKREGHILLQDPFCDFYDALDVGSDGGDCLDIDSLLQLSPTNSRDSHMNQQEMKTESEANGDDVRHEKIPLSAQRERTGKLRLKDFAGYLHLPIETAAKKLNICPTVMKKVCRRDGLSRWPFRKIKSVRRKISQREKSLSSNDVEERTSAKADIAKLEQELASIFEAFVN
ncbi:uncharacterized protein LOC132637450 [Lycium barbarum]|uniref:uncharacterized protein LOC132637450 n=1 Tax=Lycium barbarum TaxID=112863 RepID=UPI00293E2549|nr:uncharacterized protein LOC132637450 [Lycium barbarum]